MLMLPSAVKIYLAVEPVDMRKQFNGLWALASDRLREDPRQGALFVFTNKSRDRVKMLYWDGTGMCIFHKKLSEGTFPKLWAREGVEPTGIELTPNELALFLEGCKLLETQSLSTEDKTKKWLAPQGAV